MSKQCPKCNNNNIDAAHYCTECGAPLETEGFSWRKKEKRYIVVSKSDYENNECELKRLKSENRFLEQQLENNWWFKFTKWWKKIDWKEFWSWVGVCVACLVCFGVMFGSIFFDCSGGEKDNIQIKKDENNGKFALYSNTEDKLLTQYIYDSIEHHKDSTANVFYLYINGLLGVADSNGIITIDCTLDSVKRIDYTNDNLVITYSSGKQGLLNSFSGQVVIPCNNYRVLWYRESRYCYSFSRFIGTYVGNIIPVKPTFDQPWVLYNRDGKRINNQSYQHVRQTGLPNLVIVVSSTNEWLVNQNGEVISSLYYEIGNFSEGLTPNMAWAKKNNWNEPYVCIDEMGRIIFELPKGYNPYPFSEGLSAIEYKGKVGFCDNTGRYVIPMEFGLHSRNISPIFYNDKASVSYNGVDGTINKQGKFVPEKR